MGTLTALLHVSTSALAANQSALSATAENISNQTTEGYTRRATTFSGGDSVMIGGQSTSTGVIATVTAQRDNVLQRAVLQATEASSASSTRLTALNTLQSLFAIDADGGDAAGIGTAVSDFFSSASSLAASPNDNTARQTMYTRAQTLASTMNRAAAQIASQTSALNQQVTSSVGQVNGLLASVASLNIQIVQAGAGTDTSTLQDQRSLTITQLAKLVDANTVAATDGSTGVSLADGTPLVSGATVTPLKTAMLGGTVQIVSGSANVTSTIRGGSIGGALEARDEDIPGVTAKLDVIAGAIAAKVNAQNAVGTDANGNLGGAIFAGTSAATLTVVIGNGASIATSSDGSNAAALAAIGSQALVGGLTAANAFSSMITSLGQTASTAGTNCTADAAVLTQTSTQLANVSGVSLDTEAANLTQYQRSYEAAAKVLSIVNELMAQAINLGTGTTVS